MSAMRQRRCAKCKGPVHLVRQTLELPHPHPPAYKPNATITVQGLGTWHCAANCTHMLKTRVEYGKSTAKADAAASS